MKNIIVLINLNLINPTAAYARKGLDATYGFLAENLDQSHNLRSVSSSTIACDIQSDVLGHPYVWLDLDSLRLCDLDDTEESFLRALGFRWCDRCGAIVLPQERNNASTNHYGRFGGNRDERLCENCFRAYNASQNAQNVQVATTKKIHFHGYHATSRDVRVLNANGERYTLATVKGIGIEAEYNGRNCKRMDSNHDLEVPAEYAVYAEGKVRHECDCTVAGEFITNVFTERSFREFNWDLFCHCLKSIGNEDTYPNTGLHVHFSKTWFGETAKEQARNFIKFQMAFKTYEDDFKICSGRADDFHWCSFADMRTLKHWLEHVEGLADNCDDWHAFYPFQVCHGDDGCAVIASGATIEVRIGHSTNDAERLRHYVELLLGIVKACPVTKANKMYCLNKIMRFVPEATRDYWHKKGAFLRTKAVEDKGFDLN